SKNSSLWLSSGRRTHQTSGQYQSSSESLPELRNLAF
ncbi:MAG: hypothetical protein ACI901_000041, partial [Octadecabacter sp.]